MRRPTPSAVVVPLGLVLWAVLQAPGCFVKGVDEDTVISVSLAVGDESKGREVLPSEIIDLDERPCYVGVQVDADDLVEPVRTAWACDPGEDPGAQVDLSLTVTPGDDRTISVVVFLNESGLVTGFAGYSTQSLASGPVDLSLDVEELPAGSIDGFITGASGDVSRVILTDLETGVRLPSLETTASGGGFHFGTDRVPQGRFFSLTIVLAGGQEIEIIDCAVYATAGTVRVLTVDADASSC